MPRRYESLPGAATSSFPLKLGTALAARLRHGYGRADLRSDLLAGVVVVDGLGAWLREKLK